MPTKGKMVQIDPKTFMPLRFVHEATSCVGRGCSLHHPSAHRMADWPMWWSYKSKTMHRECSHGKVHPDPDDVDFNVKEAKEKRNRDDLEAHDCDGCCGYKLSEELWAAIRGVESKLEAEELAEDVDLAPQDWVYRPEDDTMWVRRR